MAATIKKYKSVNAIVNNTVVSISVSIFNLFINNLYSQLYFRFV